MRQQCESWIPDTIRPQVMATPAPAPEPVRNIVQSLVRDLGRTITAQIGGTSNVAEVDRWMTSEVEPNAVERLRLAYEVAGILADEDPRLVQGWFKSLNSGLRDRSPVVCLQTPNEMRADLLRAARTFADRG